MNPEQRFQCVYHSDLQFFRAHVPLYLKFGNLAILTKKKFILTITHKSIMYKTTITPLHMKRQKGIENSNGNNYHKNGNLKFK